MAAATAGGGAATLGNATENGTGDLAAKEEQEGKQEWRQRLDRHQSWSEQDMKRSMQERLLSPRNVGDGGFSSGRVSPAVEEQQI